MTKKMRRFQPTRNGQYIGKDAPYATREEAQAEIERDQAFQTKALADGWITSLDRTWWDIVTV